MAARKIMIQGTGSSVGKSVVTAALCRYFLEEGFRVAPFKAQNMSNNSWATADGGEIGRAQAFQAEACGIEPTVEMNPILLKPSSDTGAQVVVLGKPVGVMGAREYHRYQPRLVSIIRNSLEELSRSYDVVVIEGAGSPAEINLRAYDIVNMAVAKMASAPVVLVGDINWGGVFASLVGTLELLRADERSLVKAFLINKFRGDLSLLRDGLEFLEARTGKKVLGVLPFVKGLAVPEEDCIPDSKWRQPLARPKTEDHRLLIQVIHFPHISNSTDFDSLEVEPDVVLQYLARAPGPEGAGPDLLVLPGTKSTMADLEYLRSTGLADYVLHCHEVRVPILGICGGYQMLGRQLLDPAGVESTAPSMSGLCLLDVFTTFEPRKVTAQVRARSADHGDEIVAYEIHMGKTTALGQPRPLARIIERSGKSADDLDGTVSRDGLVRGTYLHGIFDAPAFRRRMLNELRQRRGWSPLATSQGAAAGSAQHGPATPDVRDGLAQLIRHHVDLSALNGILNGSTTSVG